MSALRSLLTFLALVAGILGVVLGGIWLLLLLAWMEFGFEGGSVREWWFVRGTLSGRLGTVAPTGPVRFHHIPADGPGLASLTTVYVSGRTAPEVIAAYERGCAQENHAIVSRESLVLPSRSDELFMKCDGKVGEVRITATPAPSGTRVTMLVLHYP